MYVCFADVGSISSFWKAFFGKPKELGGCVVWYLKLLWSREVRSEVCAFTLEWVLRCFVKTV